MLCYRRCRNHRHTLKEIFSSETQHGNQDFFSIPHACGKIFHEDDQPPSANSTTAQSRYEIRKTQKVLCNMEGCNSFYIEENESPQQLTPTNCRVHQNLLVRPSLPYLVAEAIVCNGQ